MMDTLGQRVATIALAAVLGIFASVSPTGRDVDAQAPPSVRVAQTLSSGVQITMGAAGFAPASLTIPAEVATTIALRNADVRPLNFTIAELAVAIDLAPGETRQITVTPPPGDYAFFDAIPGHRQQGFAGTLAVVPLPRPGFGFPAGVAVASTVVGLAEALPAGALSLALERLNLPPGSVVPARTAPGPELLTVEHGAAILVDGAGGEHRFAAGDGAVVPMGASYGIRTGSDEPLVIIRARIGPQDVPNAASTPTPETEDLAVPLLAGALPATPASPTFLFLVETIWAPGASLPTHEFVESAGMFVDAGALSVTGPSDIRGELNAPRGVVLPKGVVSTEQNEGDEPARVLLAGIVRPDGTLLASNLQMRSGATSGAAAQEGFAAVHAVSIPPRFERLRG